MTTLETYNASLLKLSEKKWTNCNAIQVYYRGVYFDLLERCRPGKTLEIGSGCGFIKQIDDKIVTSDVLKTYYVDCQLSAYEIEESAESWDNIIAVDVFHHLTRPIVFLESASRALAKAGRIVLCEPAATSMGTVFYQLFHQEPCQPRSIHSPYKFSAEQTGEYSNMGIGTALFQRDREKCEAIMARLGLLLKAVSYRDIIAYPLTGGFSKPAFVSAKILKSLMKFEKRLPQWLLRRMGLRMIIVIEKL